MGIDELPNYLRPAVELLSKHGLILLEYGSSLLPQYGYPIVVSTWEYAIRDDHLQRASDLLEYHGFPSVPPNPLLVRTVGDFEEKGRYHQSTTESPTDKALLQLVPLSITCVSLEDLQCTPIDTHMPPTIYRLPLPQHCISLIHCIASYPSGSNHRTKPVHELSVLVAHAIFEYEYYPKSWDKPEESEEEYREKIQFALKKIRSWTLPTSTDYWRQLLDTLVEGKSRASDIPYKPNVQK